MAIVEYVLPLGSDVRKRHIHATRKGEVISFTVQMEIKFENRWVPVVRYDCAHGYAHRDKYFLDGRRIKEKVELSFEEALTFADEDVRDNWENKDGLNGDQKFNTGNRV